MLSAGQVKAIARECGFELAGIAAAVPSPDGQRYLDWVASGMAGQMRYLTDYRAERRLDSRSLLSTAKSILCVGKLYNGPEPYTPGLTDAERAWISRYAWGDDYHEVLRSGLEETAARLVRECPGLEYKVCVDTAPLLERSYARAAGLGWLGRNTCLINEERGSWFFLGELLLSADLSPDTPPAGRCGACTACIDACPTQALGDGGLDSRLCISYLTIELRGSIPETARPETGTHVFGCDICQDVCPWNRRAAVTTDPRFTSVHYEPRLDWLASLTEQDFRRIFAGTPVSRTKYSGFLRNVAVAMGNSGNPGHVKPLERLLQNTDPMVAEHARWALERLGAPAMS
jgi:epoxyqueuosine reductase